ncbi:MAG TPA: hypothetical protein VGN26_08535 [Armatimonadota bacterium]|jgi:hypothetical protein
MSASKSSPGAAQTADTLLKGVKRWLDSGSEAPILHPPDERFALYVDWLLEGAQGSCPVPEVKTHVGDCLECYRQAEDLILTHLSAQRDERPTSFILKLSERLEDSTVLWVSDGGSVVRRPVAPLTLRSLAMRHAGFALSTRPPEPLGAPPAANRAAEGSLAGIEPTTWAVFRYRAAGRDPVPSEEEATPVPSRLEDSSAELSGILVRVWARRRSEGYDVMLSVQDRITGRELPEASVTLLNEEGRLLRDDRARQGLVFWTGLAPAEYVVNVLE